MTCRAPRPGWIGDDSGTSMIEMMVALSIMSLVMGMFTTAILSVHRFANKTESLTTAQAQINLVFLRMDREIRYAAGISAPGVLGTDPVVEYLIGASGSPVCTELRLATATGMLQERTWPQGVVPVTPSSWHTLAMGVSSATPFTVLPADDTANFLRLRLQLTSAAGAGPTATTRHADLTFTALNTSLATSSATVCTEGRAIP